MFWKDFIRDYLTFGKRDRIGAIAVLFFLAVTYTLPRIFQPKPDPNFIKVLPVLVKGVDSLEKKEGSTFRTEKDYASAYKYKKQPGFLAGELFQFDPNSISLEGWKKLGLNEKTATTIIKYRSKGGRFYKPEDLTRIWNLPPGFYDRVKNYINCESIKSPFNPYSYSNNKSQRKEIFIVEINKADTNAFIQLPGIGPRLAQRIINFRNKLGGFYSVDQIAETYGLPDSTFKMIRNYLKSGSDVKKIPLNDCSKEQLKAHPYIKWNLANAIIEYRNQHGTYKKLEELKNIVLINDSTYAKIAPYLSL